MGLPLSLLNGQPLFRPNPRRVRVELGGETVAASDHMMMLHPPGRPPSYYFPKADVHLNTLSPSDKKATVEGLGEASYWTVSAGGKVAADAAYAYSGLGDYITFDFRTNNG